MRFVTLEWSFCLWTSAGRRLLEFFLPLNGMDKVAKGGRLHARITAFLIDLIRGRLNERKRRPGSTRMTPGLPPKTPTVPQIEPSIGFTLTA